MAITIGLCDDDEEQLHLLRSYLRTAMDETAYSIVASTQPREFLRKIGDTPPQLVFLDIDMAALDGIRLGDRIKALSEKTVLIYITAHEQYALEAYRVRAFHYLLKPLSKEAFAAALREALDFLTVTASPPKIFTIQTKQELVSIRYSDILYFEKLGHRIRVCTDRRDYCYYGSLAELMKKLEGSSFVQCHQGYAVNMDKVLSFRDRTLFLEGDRQLPVSRSYTEIIRETLEKRLFA